MRARGTLILLALCLAVGAYLWFVERGKPIGEEKEAADRKLLAIPPAPVRYFQLDYGDSAVALTRSGNQWQGVIVQGSTSSSTHYRSPGPPFPADETAVEQLTSYFADLTADRLLPAAEVDSAAAGLDHPWVWVTVEATADSAAKIGRDSAFATRPPGSAVTGGQHVLAFGFQNPTRTAYYTRIDDRKDVALLSASTIDATFRRPLSDFRDRHLSRFNPDDAAKVDLASEKSTLALRKTDDRWWIVEPHVLADEAQVRGLLTRIRDLEAVELARGGIDRKIAAQLEHPALELAVRSGVDSVLAKLTIGRQLQAGGEPMHLVRASAQPVLASIRAEDFSGLAVTAMDLRDRHLLDLAGAAVDSLAITTGGRRILAAAGDSAFAEVFAGLAEWRATSFASQSAAGAAALATYGLAPPKTMLLAKLRNGGTREVYFGSAEPSGGVFAARPREPGVLVAPEAVLEAIEQALARAGATSGKKAPPPSGSP